MDFVRYAERAADLANARLDDTEALVAFLMSRAWLQEQVVERDAAALRRFQEELRPVFEASNARDEARVVELLNTLLAKHPVTPYIAGHGTRGWHLHVADRQSSVSELLVKTWASKGV